MPKSEDRKILDNLRDSHPNFEDVTNWETGPDPPDFIGTRPNGPKIGLELTEWLDAKQATRSITRMEAEYRWIEALATEKQSPPKSFDRVILAFKNSVRFNEHDAPRFRDEFYALVWKTDEHADRLTVLNAVLDLSPYPTLKRYLRGLSFQRLPDKYCVTSGQRWVATGGKFYPSDPQNAMRSLLETIEKKISKKDYVRLKQRLNIQELILVVHFGLRGVLHAAPSIAISPILLDLIPEVRSRFSDGAGPFNKIYLYLALNEGPLHLIYP